MAAAEGLGHLFIIDERVWAKVTSIGMSAAVAYLVLACGTGRDNKATPWSIKAVKKYAGMGWARAKPAIDELIAGGFIRLAESHTVSHPRYELATLARLVEFQTAENSQSPLGFDERRVFTNLQEGRQPESKTARRFAEGLCRRGFLCRDAQGIYKLPEPATEASGDLLIWLPNSIVKGTPSGEESPVLRLRGAGCLWTLRLFVDLYSAQNLRDDGGINPRLVWRPFERRKIGEQGAYTVWGFKPGIGKLWPTCGPFAAHESRKKAKPKDCSPTWESINLMEAMGLLSFVPHIFENDTAAAEPIHPYGIGGSSEATIEPLIGSAADEAARAMALPSKLEEAIEDGFEYFCPVVKTKPRAQMIGVARLTYRPHTRRTAEWFAELNQNGHALIDTFEKLTDKAKASASVREANYA
jgi:hypothetical protein